jgi:hypothetical protein
VVAATLGSNHLRVMLADLSAAVLYDVEQPVDVSVGPNALIEGRGGPSAEALGGVRLILEHILTADAVDRRVAERRK